MSVNDHPEDCHADRIYREFPVYEIPNVFVVLFQGCHLWLISEHAFKKDCGHDDTVQLGRMLFKQYIQSD
jgi:hypothetical protein